MEIQGKPPRASTMATVARKDSSLRNSVLLGCIKYKTDTLSFFQKKKLAFFPMSANHPSLLSSPQTFSTLILPVSEEGRRETGSSRDSCLTCFPGPRPRLCSTLIGESGCGTHSSSTSGFISGFYQRPDKQLLYRQSRKTLDARKTLYG